MGIAADRKRKFYRDHPICCFCGGETPAVTQDHVPSRSFFRNRCWPEGYVFPACESCNARTAKDETLSSLICRIASNHERDAESDVEVKRLMLEVARSEPETFQSFFVRPIDVRQWLREHDLTLSEGMATTDVPVMSLRHPRVTASMQRYATKLFLSLYYRHTGQALPAAGGIPFMWYSNATHPDRRPPMELLAKHWQGFPEPARQGTSLGDQFAYAYAVTTDGGPAAAFMVEFNVSIVMLGFVFPDIVKVHVPEQAVVLRPFRAVENVQPRSAA
ncbi:HNH endonuclease [Ralstonia pseudosolanacearum]